MIDIYAEEFRNRTVSSVRAGNTRISLTDIGLCRPRRAHMERVSPFILWQTKIFSNKLRFQ
jgi:hypothetical protein